MQTRRGTVLLMVIGVLALMAIITVVYATIGRADRSASIAMAQSESVQDQSEAIAGYFNEQISKGVFAAIPDVGYVAGSATKYVGLKNNDPFSSYMRTKGYDLALTDDHAVSVYRETNAPGAPWITGAHLFSASGDFTVIVPQNGVGPAPEYYPNWFRDPNGAAPNTRNWPRESGTPFLSSIEPTSLRVDTSLNPRVADYVLAETAQAKLPQAAHRLIRDWRVISNLAPSGNFVNLWNLRNHFDAESGFERDSRGLPRMSDRLTLFDAKGAQPYDTGMGAVTPMPATSIGLDPDADLTFMRRADGVRPRYNNPADWSMYQLFAFRPMVDVRFPVDDPRYLPYQWADADGDGLADSRWFELTKLRWDSTSGTGRYSVESVLAELTKGRLSSNTRLFVAAKVIDNSAMVNVNTATSFHAGPSSNSPPGLTPADIDLRRLLTLYDKSKFWSRFPVLQNTIYNLAPYGLLPQPAVANAPGDYSNCTESPLATNTTDFTASSIGIGGFAGLTDVRNSGTMRLGDATSQANRLYSEGPSNSGRYVIIPPYSADTRTSYYEGVVQSLTQNNAAGRAMGTRVKSLFDLSDEYELRLYNGLNDENTTSRLEVAIGGRFETDPPPVAMPLGKLSVLRDNRPRSLERRGRDVLWPDNPNIGFSQTLTANDSDADRAMLAYQFDVRRDLTTVSGARPIIEGPADGTLRTALDATTQLGDLTTGDYVLTSAGLSQAAALAISTDLTGRRYDAIRRIFGAYADALLPYSNQINSWSNFANMQGLAYAGTSEQAIRMAAHMALNLCDSFDIDRFSYLANADDDCVPTAMTLLVSREALIGRPPVNNDRLYLEDGSGGTLPTFRGDYPWPGLFIPQPTTDGIVRRDPRRLAPTATPTAPFNNMDAAGLRDTRGNPAVTLQDANGAGSQVERVNMYGIEPQPFLIEVGYYTISTDAHPDKGGDQDGDETNTMPPDNWVTLNRDRELGNADFLCDILTFTLNNPFEQRVYLYKNTGVAQDRAKPRYYIQYANRFWLLAKQVDDPARPIAIDTTSDVYLEPGETKVFYATNPGRLKEVADRINATKLGGAPFTTSELRAWLKNQFGARIEDQPMVMVNPEKFEAVGDEPNTYDVRFTDVNSPMPANNGTTRSGEMYTRYSLTGIPNLDESGNPGSATSGEDSGALQNGFSLNFGGARQGSFATPSELGWGTADNNECGVAMLWRVMRTPPGVSPSGVERSRMDDPTQETNDNDIATDLLADRLRDPALAEAGQKGVVQHMLEEVDKDDTRAPEPIRNGWEGMNNESCTATPSTEKNRGVVVFSTARFGRPLNSTTKLPIGYLPPWCMESKVDRSPTAAPQDWKYSGDYTIKGTRRTTPWSLNWAEYVDGKVPAIGRSICEFFGAGSTIMGPGSKSAAHTRTPASNSMSLNNIRALGSPGQNLLNASNLDYERVAPVYVSRSLVTFGTNKSIVNPGLYSRSGDFLLPLAIGPENTPERVASGSTVMVPGARSYLGELESRWLTLSEAIALAAGYYSPDPQVVGAPVYASNPLHAQFAQDVRVAGQAAPAPAFIPKTSRGQVMIDAWNPYIEIGTPPQFVPIGTGVPYALGVIDHFRAAPGVSTIVATGVNDSAYGGVATLRPGVINANTASNNVLRMLPMVSPDSWSDAGRAGPPSVSSSWVAATSGPLALPDEPFPSRAANSFALMAATTRWDAAAALAGYRDRADVGERALAPPNILAKASFQDQNALPSATTGGVFDGRERAARVASAPSTGIGLVNPGMGYFAGRSAQGFRSLGELAMAKEGVSFTPTTMPASPARIIPSSTVGVQRFGHNPAINAPNLDPRISGVGFVDRVPATGLLVQPAMPGQPPTIVSSRTNTSDQVADTLQNKLAIVNALTNTTSVRSDVFTVYFLVHGYTRDDVEGLADTDPMTPSFAKRYMMVVDRSNVTRPGEKAKVLMFKEVPLE